jgi:hypothetical protein
MKMHSAGNVQMRKSQNFNKSGLHGSFNLDKNRSRKLRVWSTFGDNVVPIRSKSTSASSNQAIKTFAAVDRPWRSFAEVIENWKSVVGPDSGFDGVRPELWAIHFLEDFSARAASEVRREPEPYFSADGEIGLRWIDQDLMASISVTKDGSILAFLKKPLKAPLRINGLQDWYENINAFIVQLR